MDPSTLIIGIQDLNAIPYRATLRVKQHANTLRNATYWNVGNRQWNTRSKFSKGIQLVRFARPWREPFCAYHYSNFAGNTLIRFLQRNKFRRIILTEIWTYYYLRIVKKYGKDAQIVFDFHNVESALQLDIASKKDTRLEWLRYKLIRRMEQRIMRKVNEVWVCSDDDKRQMELLYGERAGFFKVVPNRFNVNGQFLEKLTDEKRIGYVGCFNYPPNEEAALELLYHVRPSIGATLRLIGKNPTNRINAWKGNNIEITGEVLSVSDAIASVRTMVLPIRSGSGTRLKVLEAFAHGIPVVATAKAVEGIECESGKHFLQAETQEEFRIAILTRWENPDYEEELRINARKLVEEKYAWRKPT